MDRCNNSQRILIEYIIEESEETLNPIVCTFDYGKSSIFEMNGDTNTRGNNSNAEVYMFVRDSVCALASAC